MALAGSLDREADTRMEQEPGVEGKTKKLTRFGGDQKYDNDCRDDNDDRHDDDDDDDHDDKLGDEEDIVQ